MYLFILEGIGTQELILIGLVALIVFGPRKLPEIARTIGKTMADFRKVTGDFKQTWEKEVEEDKQMLKTFGEDPILENNSISQPVQVEEKLLTAPTIKELSPEEVAKIFNKEIAVEATEVQEPQTEEPQTKAATLSKRDWL